MIVLAAIELIPPVLQARRSGRQPRMLLEAKQPQPGSDPMQRAQVPGKLRDRSPALSLLRPIPQYLKAANGDEHSARESTLYLQAISCDGHSRRPHLHRSRSASAIAMGVHLEAANGDEHSARESALIHGCCAPLLGQEFVAPLSATKVCGCELSVPNQHFRNAVLNQHF